jgi:hypothetical protein
MAANRSCQKCGKTYQLTTEFFRQVLGRDKTTLYFKRVCKSCERNQSRDYQRRHPNKARINNEKLLSRDPEYIRRWKLENSDQQRVYRRKYESQIKVKLKKRVSCAIIHQLNKANSCKTSSVLKFLPYSIEELRKHLEFQFEPWMNWDNWGVYNPKTWNDEDSLTWTWQLDHKIPMANHTYSCQDDPGFLEAWKLENLRPLKAKDNIILGAKMKRTKRGSL